MPLVFLSFCYCYFKELPLVPWVELRMCQSIYLEQIFNGFNSYIVKQYSFEQIQVLVLMMFQFPMMSMIIYNFLYFISWELVVCTYGIK
jgi:hypothetical protein